MPTAETSLGDHWRDHCLSASILLQILSGDDSDVTPRKPQTPESFVDLVNAVAMRSYVRSETFDSGAVSHVRLIETPPPLKKGVRYGLITLNVTTQRSETISVKTGGIAFEDPIWALLAAHAMSKELPVALPLARINDDLWRSLPRVVSSIRNSRYAPAQFLGRTQGLVSGSVSPQFEWKTVDSERLAALRQRGFQSLNVPLPRFYELYGPELHRVEGNE
jgi:hypothetical protein